MAKDTAKKQPSQDSQEKGAEKANEQAEKQVEEANEQGFRGTEVDTTPNENYTVEGVTSGKPVPEAAEDPAVARREATNDEA